MKVNPEITILQTMLAECQEKLKKLTQIESRLDSLEEKMKGKVMVNEKSWTNLLSRVTLLETELLLSKKVFFFPLTFIGYLRYSEVSIIVVCICFLEMLNKRIFR